MTGEFTAENLYWNKSLGSFFMTSQAYETFEKLVQKYDHEEVFNAIDDYYEDVDSMSDDFHDLQEDELCDLLGIDYIPEDDESEDDE